MKRMDLYWDNTPKIFYTDKMLSLQTGSTSKGNQAKWYDKKSDCYVKGQFFYQDKYWRDDLVERIAVTIGKQLPLDDKNVDILEQNLCIIDTGYQQLRGVFSSNFCGEGEQYVSFYRIMQSCKMEFPVLGTIKEKWDFVLDLLKKITGIDCTDYFIVMFILDFLVGNEDRHLGNFGVITNEHGFRLAPLFDFGLGLFEHDRIYEGIALRDCIQKMKCQPFAKQNLDVLHFLQDSYELVDYLPDKIDLSGVALPSAKAGSYILNRANLLAIGVEGIE